jgi:hypothetical protein
VADETDNIIDQLCNIMDTVSEPILKMTDEEIRAEVIDRGEDPDKIAAEVEAKTLLTIKNYKQRHLRAAQQQYENELIASKQRESKLPTSAEDRRALLRLVCRQNPELGVLTLRHRNFEELTEIDITSSLEELQELGALDELRDDQDSE